MLFFFRCEKQPRNDKLKFTTETVANFSQHFASSSRYIATYERFYAGEPTRRDVQPHIRRHPQSDRQIGKCITGVSPQANARGCLRADTHRRPTHPVIHSPWPCLLTAITALEQSTPSFLRFLHPGTILCALQKVIMSCLLFHCSSVATLVRNTD